MADPVVEDQQRWQSVAGVYDSPQGAASFLQTLAEFFQRNFDLPITEKNISLTNGSQNSFFLLFRGFLSMSFIIFFRYHYYYFHRFVYRAIRYF